MSDGDDQLAGDGSGNPTAEAPAGEAPSPNPESPEPVDSGFGGAPDDQEMPITEHIEEMVRRLGIVLVILAVVSAIVFPLADRLINGLWYSFLPGPPTECVQVAIAQGPGSTTDAACPRLYHPLSLVLARLKVASLVGFIFALPVFVYQSYLFMRPGLYPNERRYYLASVPTSLILAGIGVAFAHFLVLRVIFIYFLGYSQPVAEVAFSLSQTFDLILLMLGMFAFIFQIPLFVMLAIMMGVTTRYWLENRRLYFWMGFAGVAFIFSPDPTGMAPFIVALTMVLLFEGTLLLLRWTGR
jgi:sec-independent protein translocase protein TatC